MCDPLMSLSDIRQQAESELPGVRIQRYLPVFADLDQADGGH